MTALQKSIAASDLQNVPLLRIEAVNGRDIDYDGLLTKQARAELADLKLTGKRTHHAQLSPGAVGCYLSHYGVWQAVANAKNVPRDAPFLILEDDAAIPQNAHAMFTHGWNTVQATRRVDAPRDAEKPYLVLWHVICLSGCAVPSNNLFEPRSFWSTMAYSLTPDSASALLRLPLFPIDVQIDTQLYLMRDRLRVFAFPCLRPTNSDTDIQASIVPNAPHMRQVTAVKVDDVVATARGGGEKGGGVVLNTNSSNVLPTASGSTSESVSTSVSTSAFTMPSSSSSSSMYVALVIVLAVLLCVAVSVCIGVGVHMSATSTPSTTK